MAYRVWDAVLLCYPFLSFQKIRHLATGNIFHPLSVNYFSAQNSRGIANAIPSLRSQTMSMMVGARSTQSSEINVTPLIDVLLVLLIIFMVILPDHKWGEKTLVPQPSTESVEKNPPTPIVIQLKDVGEGKRPLLKINQEEVSWDALEPRLAAVFKVQVDRVAFVKGDPEVDFEYVAQAVDITHHAGADRIGLLGKKD